MEKYTLIITEKPNAAFRIASALDLRQNARKIGDHGVPYYVAERERKIVVVPSLGHLYTVAGGSSRRNYFPVFNLKWVPLYAVEGKAKHIRNWLQVISKLARGADKFIDACDYDIEGSIIGFSILKYACKNKEKVARRMKYSTLTKEELEKSYCKALPQLDFALIEAGRTRHEVDWLHGINLSRALTIAARDFSGKYATLSTGRVQGPVLKFLGAREASIKSFIPTPYWRIKVHFNAHGQVFEADYEKPTIETKKEADIMLSTCRQNDGQIEEVGTRQFKQSPPLPFDLGALQGEAYALFRYGPKQTSDIAQRLYLDALISYPRTSSQKLPLVINYRMILSSLSRFQEYSRLASELSAKPELRPNEGRKDDLAHPAIYPTGKLPDRALNRSERNIWDLIVRRFMAVLGDPAMMQILRICVNVKGYRFNFRGKQTLADGWQRFYKPYVKFEQTHWPRVREGETVKLNKVSLTDSFTKPPSRYNPCSLLKKMEEQEIGTKATRADIIQVLYDRKYVKNEQMTVTDLGSEVLDILKNYCPKIISIGFTKELEQRMNKILEGKKTRQDVLLDVVDILRHVLKKLKEKESIIGERLSKTLEKARLEERAIGACPSCKTGRLVMLHSKKTGKRFIGCTNYFKGLCDTSFPLPQTGTIRPRRSCPTCGWPTVQVRTRGRRSWTLCFNPECMLRKRRRANVEMPNLQ